MTSFLFFESFLENRFLQHNSFFFLFFFFSPLKIQKRRKRKREGRISHERSHLGGWWRGEERKKERGKRWREFPTLPIGQFFFFFFFFPAKTGACFPPHVTQEENKVGGWVTIVESRQDCVLREGQGWWGWFRFWRRCSWLLLQCCLGKGFTRNFENNSLPHPGLSLSSSRS